MLSISNHHRTTKQSHNETQWHTYTSVWKYKPYGVLTTVWRNENSQPLWKSIAASYLVKRTLNMYNPEILSWYHPGELEIFTHAKTCTWVSIGFTYNLKNRKQPWLVWLSGLSTDLRTKVSLVRSQSGLMPGLWARSLVWGTREATTHWYFSPSLSPSLPLSLKISK